MGDISSKCNKISQCYITPHINPVNALLQNLQPVVKSESHKCLLVISKGMFEFFSPDGLCSVLPINLPSNGRIIEPYNEGSQTMTSALSLPIILPLY